MRRAIAVIVSTLGGLALLASFHTTPGVATRPAASGRAALQPPAGGRPPKGASGPGSPATVPPTSASTAPPTSVPTLSPTSTPTAPPTSPPTTAPPTRRTIVGPVSSNPYGDVQVEIVVQGGRLADVEALELPQDRRRSAEISSIAGPELRQEALQAGSANIDVISGATYTSESYAQSLQAALDQAGL